MKELKEINNALSKINTKEVSQLLDKITFKNILFIWLVVILAFGLAYHLFSGINNYLMYTSGQQSKVTSLPDSIYFSFVAATTTGFGDIVPNGMFKTISIIELVSGLMLLALVTSKLVSLKQDVILGELYEISFNEKINRLRSSLLLFRQNISRTISWIEEGTIKNREIREIYIYMSSLEDTLNEILKFMKKPDKKQFIKIMDPVNTELIFNSISTSFERLNELVTLMNDKKMDWKRDITIELIKRCVSLHEKLFSNLSTEILSEKIINQLNERNSNLIEAIKAGTEKQTPI